MQAVAIVTLRSQVIGLLLVSVLCLLCWVLGCWVACAFVIVPIPKTTQPFVFNCCCFNCCHCLNVSLRLQLCSFAMGFYVASYGLLHIQQHQKPSSYHWLSLAIVYYCYFFCLLFYCFLCFSMGIFAIFLYFFSYLLTLQLLI
jgi:hypothetical protein